jgi:hypothetical protein
LKERLRREIIPFRTDKALKRLVYHGRIGFECPQNEGLFVYLNIQFFKSKKLMRERLSKSCCSSVVEHLLGKEEVGSSILLNSSLN